VKNEQASPHFLVFAPSFVGLVNVGAERISVQGLETVAQ
jgi:hypothetical protein